MIFYLSHQSYLALFTQGPEVLGFSDEIHNPRELVSWSLVAEEGDKTSQELVCLPQSFPQKASNTNQNILGYYVYLPTQKIGVGQQDQGLHIWLYWNRVPKWPVPS